MSEMDNNSDRTNYFKKDERLEDALKDLNTIISEVVPTIVDNSNDSPIVLIMGCARSGSTLLLQWLASLGIFSYPSNLIARYYQNPYVGIRSQQALLEYDPLNQLGFNTSEAVYSSALGKTEGALAPSEFWYFWKDYFNFDEDEQVLSEEILKGVDSASFLNKLAAFEHLTKKPLALKGMIMNWHIPYLYEQHRKFIFVNMVRDSFSNAQSLLLARETYFNDRSKWYSFKPPAYSFLKDKDPISQVAGQVVYTEKAINDGLQEIPTSNKLTITYEDFCNNPSGFLDSLQEKFYDLGATLNLGSVATERLKPFTASTSIKLSQNESQRLKEEIANFKTGLI